MNFAAIKLSTLLFLLPVLGIGQTRIDSLLFKQLKEFRQDNTQFSTIAQVPVVKHVIYLSEHNSSGHYEPQDTANFTPFQRFRKHVHQKVTPYKLIGEVCIRMESTYQPSDESIAKLLFQGYMNSPAHKETLTSEPACRKQHYISSFTLVVNVEENLYRIYNVVLLYEKE
jgi:hypothetical protein